MSDLTDLAVVIPTLNAAPHLAMTLAALPRVAHVIVVDGGSTDDTAQIAAAHGAHLVTAPPGRGRQLAAGAATAASPWLLFLHADTHLDAAAWAAARRHLAEPAGPDRAGVFHLRLDDPAWPARLLEIGVKLRVAALALPYGDQGLLISRRLYDAVGGFAPLPLMEDVDLVRRLGRGRLTSLSGTATTSAERWRRRGWLRQTLTNLRCLSLYLAGVAPERIARIYGR